MEWLIQGLRSLPWVVEGGWMMLPIYLCSVVAFTLFCERIYSLRPTKILPSDLIIVVGDLTERGLFEQALTVCKKSDSPLARIFAKGLISSNKGRLVIRDAMQESGKQQAALLSRYVNALGTIAATSPLLGLLGTVSGMINAFQVIREMGVGHADQLSGGISEALLTTAAGLLVAIPAMVAYRYLQSRVMRFVLRLQEEAHDISELIASVAADKPEDTGGDK